MSPARAPIPPFEGSMDPSAPRPQRPPPNRRSAHIRKCQPAHFLRPDAPPSPPPPPVPATCPASNGLSSSSGCGTRGCAPGPPGSTSSDGPSLSHQNSAAAARDAGAPLFLGLRACPAAATAAAPCPACASGGSASPTGPTAGGPGSASSARAPPPRPRRRCGRCRGCPSSPSRRCRAPRRTAGTSS